MSIEHGDWKQVVINPKNNTPQIEAPIFLNQAILVFSA